MKIIKTIFLAVLLIFISKNCLFAQTETTIISNSDCKDIIDKISNLLVDEYIFPLKADSCSQFIRVQFKNGKYDNATNPEDLAKLLTIDLKKISMDEHMNVSVKKQNKVEEADPESNYDDQIKASIDFSNLFRKYNCAFYKVEHLKGNIGYLDLRGFHPVEFAKETAKNAMGFLSGSNAIIIDLRKSLGGDPATVQLLISYFLDSGIHYASTEWKGEPELDENWTLEEIDGARMLDTPLFILTGEKTRSAAEAFTYILKNQKRAKIIGAKTIGAGNIGGVFSIDERFEIFIPYGRPICQVTLTNWDSKGVIPDIISPEEDALEIALKEAVEAARKFQELRDKKIAILIEEMDSVFSKYKSISEGNDKGLTENSIITTLDNMWKLNILPEEVIKIIGDRYIEIERIEEAIIVFSYGVNKYNSPDLFENLAETYMKNGQMELAKKNYEKLLKLNPENKNAKKMIKKLKN